MDKDWLLIFVGALGFVILSHQIPILRQLNERGSATGRTVGLDQIQGIDLQSLNICRQKGLM